MRALEICVWYTPYHYYSVQCTPVLTTSCFKHATVNSEGDDIVAKARVVYKPPKCRQVGQRDGDIRKALVDLQQTDHDSDFEVTAVAVDNKDGATVGGDGDNDDGTTDVTAVAVDNKDAATAGGDGYNKDRTAVDGPTMPPSKRSRKDTIPDPSPVSGRTRTAVAVRKALPTGDTPVSGHTRSRGMTASLAGKHSSGQPKASTRVTRSTKFLPFRSCLINGEGITDGDDGSLYFACRPQSSGGMLCIEKGLETTPTMEDWYKIFRGKKNKPVIRRFNNSLDTPVFQEMLEKMVPRWVNLLEMLSTYNLGYPKVQVKARLTLHPVGLFTVCIAHPVEFRTYMTYPVTSALLSTCYTPIRYRSRNASLVN